VRLRAAAGRVDESAALHDFLRDDGDHAVAVPARLIQHSANREAIWGRGRQIEVDRTGRIRLKSQIRRAFFVTPMSRGLRRLVVTFQSENPDFVVGQRGISGFISQADRNRLCGC